MAASSLHFAYLFKIIIVGDSGVGKSSLLMRFTDRRFKEVNTTVGVEFGSRIIDIEGDPVKVHVWDTAGQEAFRSITRSYYRGSAGAIIAFDLTSVETFRSVQSWLKEARDNCQSHLQVILVGCKCDMPNRKVAHEDASRFAGQNGLEYIEASSLSDINVDQVFESLCKKIYRIVKDNQVDFTNDGSGVKLGPMRSGAGPAKESPAGGGCC
eukprot:m.31246 g.31246  ORF g.31246 m.31246 type:complete len:211 (+) comp9299_c1_seq1:51-683(+)